MKISSTKFAGHQSYHCRYTWLTKGILSCNEDPHIFREEDALVELGVGKNMVDAIRHWCLATRILEKDPTIDNNRGSHLRPTLLGRKIFLENGGWDRYLEDAGTVWLLHYRLATNPEWTTTAYFAFNEMRGLEFTRDSLQKDLIDLDKRISKRRSSENSIRRDVNVFIRTYVSSHDTAKGSVEDLLDCPFAELGLIREDPGHSTYAFSRGYQHSLPNVVVLYAIWEYAQGKGGQQTFTFDELAYQPLSPGQVFKLDERALAERLEELARQTTGAIQLTETAGYRQVLITQDFEPWRALDRYYERRWGEDSNGRD
jgi:hypothetical protein